MGDVFLCVISFWNRFSKAERGKGEDPASRKENYGAFFTPPPLLVLLLQAPPACCPINLPCHKPEDVGRGRKSPDRRRSNFMPPPPGLKRGETFPGKHAHTNAEEIGANGSSNKSLRKSNMCATCTLFRQIYDYSATYTSSSSLICMGKIVSGGFLLFTAFCLAIEPS